MAKRNVTHFMPDNRFDFVVVHHVHQPAVDADAAVGHGEGVDVFSHVDLIVHRLAIDVVTKSRSNLIQTLSVSAACRCDGGFTVHLLTGLIA
ncbi:hypothetical protein D3C76_1673750 [compost metagenome]